MPEVKLLLSDGSEYQEKGHIDAISGMIDTSTGSVTLRDVFPNSKNILRSGSTGNIIDKENRKEMEKLLKLRSVRLTEPLTVY